MTLIPNHNKIILPRISNAGSVMAYVRSECVRMSGCDKSYLTAEVQWQGLDLDPHSMIRESWSRVWIIQNSWQDPSVAKKSVEDKWQDPKAESRRQEKRARLVSTASIKWLCQTSNSWWVGAPHASSHLFCLEFAWTWLLRQSLSLWELCWNSFGASLSSRSM